MSSPWSAADVARLILEGFDDYRYHFRRSTNGAQSRFEQALWQEAQAASAARISLYEEKVSEVTARLIDTFSRERLLDANRWSQVKRAYIERIDPRLDDELAETWYNSIFCSLFSHDLISDDCMFIHTTRPASGHHESAPQSRTYLPKGDLSAMLAEVFSNYRFTVAYADLAGDLQHLEALLRGSLPDWVCKDPALTLELYSSVLYRNKGAYLVGRIYTLDEQWPLVIALLHREGQGVQIDTLITDEAEVSIIFSFTRSYFMVDVPVPAEFVGFERHSAGQTHCRAVHLDRFLQARKIGVLPRADQAPGRHR